MKVLVLLLWLGFAGCTPVEIYKRIMQGRDCRANEAHYQVALCILPCNRPATDADYAALGVTPHPGSVFCGGSLIGSRWVLSAAHCYYQNFHVLIGTHVVGPGARNVNPIAGHGIQHPQYNGNTFENDIMLVRLNTAVAPGPTIAIVPLPTPTLCNANGVPPSSSTWLAAGWGISGHTPPHAGNNPAALTPFRLQCLDTHLGQCVGVVFPYEFCAGGEGDCANRGDSGGSLVTGNHLYGVIVRVNDPRINGFKMVKVCHFRQWIDNQLRATP